MRSARLWLLHSGGARRRRYVHTIGLCPVLFPFLSVRSFFLHQQILVVDDSDDPGSDSDYDASSESESSTTNKTEKSEKSEKTEKTDVEFDYSDSNSEDEMRAEEQVRRTIVKHQDTMGLLGTAEQLRRKSATGQAFQTANGSKKASSKTVQATLPPQYYPLTYPTADPDVGEGFQLSGFLNGKRVYRLESE